MCAPDLPHYDTWCLDCIAAEHALFTPDVLIDCIKMRFEVLAEFIVDI